MRRRGGFGVLLVLALAVVVAACSGGGSEDVADRPPDLESVGTEAWMGEGVDPGATAVPPGPSSEDPTAAGEVEVPTGPASAPPPAGGDAAPVDPSTDVAAIVASMTVEQKVGQLFTATVIGDDAVSVSDAAATANQALYGVATPAEVVERYHLGGVAYFAHDQGPGTSNVADPVRTAALSAGLQQAAAAGSGIGLLIGADQEGGPVVRLRSPVTVFPSARDVARTGDVDLAREVGQVTGTEMRAVGVNWVYAPVADVNVNPSNPVIGERAFGTSADAVVPFVRATAEGLAAGGVLPTLKHFPGHGDTDIDSHSSLPTITHDAATLESVDWPPFALAEELAPISVMVGHLAVPSLDPSGRPATISADILSVLRDDAGAGGQGDGGLGFDGLVVTDAMNMGALTGFGDAGSLAVDAIVAGVDVVLMPSDLPVAWEAVRAAVESGEISAARLDEAVTRILEAKAAIGVLDARAAGGGIDPSVLGTPAHADVRARVEAACGC